jgi:protein-disulfide isomerase
MDNQTNTNQTTKPWYKKWWAILLFLFLTFILICGVAFSFLIYNKVQAIKNQPQTANLKKYDQTEGINSYSMGSTNPKLTIVEFGDFACPHCLASFPIIRTLVLKYYKDVKLVYRHYPYLADYSMDLAMGAECAGQQGLFWPMHDKLFQNQGDNANTPDKIATLAKQVGVNLDLYNKCVTTKQPQTKINRDLADAERLDVKGTPTWFFNGYKVDGEVPADTMEAMIKELIK